MARTIAELQAKIRAFVEARDWEQFHDPKNLSMLLASEVGELLAEFRWLTPEQSRAASVSEELRERVSEEIGDVGIALLSICDKLSIDLLSAVERKLAANATRYPVDRARGRPDRPRPDF